MSPRAWFALAARSVLWGMPYLFIKVAVEDGLSPGFLSWARLALAAVALGVSVLGERPGAGAVAGLLLILAGSWLSRRPTAPRARRGGRETAGERRG